MHYESREPKKIFAASVSECNVMNPLCGWRDIYYRYTGYFKSPAIVKYLENKGCLKKMFQIKVEFQVTH